MALLGGLSKGGRLDFLMNKVEKLKINSHIALPDLWFKMVKGNFEVP